MENYGVVSVVAHGEVALKFMTTTKIEGGERFVGLLRTLGLVSLENGARIALKYGFGNEESLIAMDGESEIHQGKNPLSPKYREHFGDPEYHPASPDGSAEFVRVIHL